MGCPVLSKRLLQRRTDGRKVLTALYPALSVVKTTTGGGWNFSPSTPENAIDGSDSTYAQWVGTTPSVITNGYLTLTFQGIAAARILKARFRCKGKGGTSGLVHTMGFLAAADASPVPSGADTFSFSAGGASTIIDTGLTDEPYALSNSNVFVDWDADSFVGNSSTVLDWWAGGPKLQVRMSDFNGGGTGGLNYSPMLQVLYEID